VFLHDATLMLSITRRNGVGTERSSWRQHVRAVIATTRVPPKGLYATNLGRRLLILGYQGIRLFAMNVGGQLRHAIEGDG